MPGQFIPRNSGPHRIACIALYRALLAQCPRIPLPADLPSRGPLNPIKHLIHKRFKRNVTHTSPRLIIAALKAGYKTEELLRSAGDGNPASTSQIHNLLRTLHSQSIAARAAAPPPKPRVDHASKIRAYPGAPKVVDVRPLPREKLSGLRRVPIITSTTAGFPFLRFKKPQSPFLSRVLKQKLQRKQKRTDYFDKMQLDIELGREEALWEEVVLDVLDVEGGNGGRNGARNTLGEDWGKGSWTWMKDTMEARRMMSQHMNDEQMRAKALGEKMVEIVEKEKVLWKEERGLRRHEKNIAKRARKLEKKRDSEG